MQGRLQPGSAAGLAMVAILAQQVLASLCSSPATCACVLGPLAQTHGRTRQCAPRNRASAKRMCAGALASLAGARTLCDQSLCARDRAVWRAKRTRRALTRLPLRGMKVAGDFGAVGVRAAALQSQRGGGRCRDALRLRGGMPVFFSSGGGFPGGGAQFFNGMPPGFEGFGGMGGQGGGGRPQSDNTRFYKLLGVEKDASESEIKKAYRKMAIKNHPDKGGDAEKFKEISMAYEVLSDPEKKQMYDQYGEDAVKNDGQGMGGGVDPFDIFNSFFGGGGMGQRRQQKTQDVMHKLSVPLEELYSGSTKKLALNRHIADGNGRVTKKKEVLEVRIERGMEDGRKIVFKEKADEMPGAITGDVVLVVAQAAHPLFKRQGPHLTMEKDITLRDALCGFTFAIKHLDKRQVVVSSAKGEVTQPNSWICVSGEGMPIKGNQFNKGNLFIKLNVKFPRLGELEPEVFAQLAKLLPASPAVDTTEECDEHVAKAISEEDIVRQLQAAKRGGGGGGRGHATDESDSDEGGGHPFGGMGGGMGGQQVQCQQS